MTTRKRGAPIGNTNAIKHGRYARQLQDQAKAAAFQSPGALPGDLQRDLRLIQRIKNRLDDKAILSPLSMRTLKEIDSYCLILLAIFARSLCHAAPDHHRLNLAIETALTQILRDLDSIDLEWVETAP